MYYLANMQLVHSDKGQYLFADYATIICSFWAYT